MMMLHGLCKWSLMLSIHLWPYGLCTANDICNSTPRKGSDISPIELFSGVTICPKLKHYHSFGCPTYVLDKELQAQKSLRKWHSRARLGVYLGPLPNHSRSVSLVLNPHTGHVSPQFHVKHDEFFETVDGQQNNYDAPAATWKELSSLASTQSKDMVPSTIRPLRERMDIPTSTTDHVSQDDLYANPLELMEDTNQIEETSAAVSPQEESATSMEHSEEQQQTCSGRVVHNTACYMEGLEQQEQGIVTWKSSSVKMKQKTYQQPKGSMRYRNICKSLWHMQRVQTQTSCTFMKQ